MSHPMLHKVLTFVVDLPVAAVDHGAHVEDATAHSPEPNDLFSGKHPPTVHVR